jgi:hypothetical protein
MVHLFRRDPNILRVFAANDLVSPVNWIAGAAILGISRYGRLRQPHVERQRTESERNSRHRLERERNDQPSHYDSHELTTVREQCGEHHDRLFALARFSHGTQQPPRRRYRSRVVDKQEVMSSLISRTMIITK